MNKDRTISVILPTLNEEENLKLLVPEIIGLFEETLNIKYEIIVVDDGSIDSTVDYISNINSSNKSVRVISRKSEKSLPLSILEGIKNSKFDNVMWLDADGSMTVRAIKQLVDVYFKNIDKNHYRVVIGSRFADGGGYKGVKDVKNQSIISSINNVRESNDSVFGMLLSIIINKLLSFLFKSQLTDLTSGFILMNKQDLRDEIFENKNYGEYFIYLIGHLLNNNVEIEEVGYICETRLHGYSKTGSGIIKFIIRGIPYIKAALNKGIEKWTYMIKKKTS